MIPCRLHRMRAPRLPGAPAPRFSAAPPPPRLPAPVLPGCAAGALLVVLAGAALATAAPPPVPAPTPAPGPPAAAPSPASYRLPFAAGDTHRCTQSRGGGTSHKGTLGNAVDFLMPEGTVVCAARDGRVVAVKSDGSAGGPSTAYTPSTNYIHIDHGDGTLGRYMHLRKDGVLVKVGDVVCRGDAIAYSGNTGFSTGPHLHFDVWRGGVTIPFAFEDVATDGGVPQVGRDYTSRNAPGIPAAAKAEIADTLRRAEFLRRFGAFTLAYPLYARLAARQAGSDYEPLRLAAGRVREIEAGAQRIADEADALVSEGRAREALERLAPACAAFNGIPAAQRARQACAELARSDEGRRTIETLRDALQAQERLFWGLQCEADGRLDAAAHFYRQIADAHAATPAAAQARERLEEIAPGTAAKTPTPPVEGR